MTTPLAPYGDPTDEVEQEKRKHDERRREIAANIEFRKDLTKRLAGPRGRRDVRRLLAQGRIYVSLDHVGSVFDRHSGKMCADEALRTSALQTIWPVLRALALKELPFSDFEKLMLETDT